MSRFRSFSLFGRATLHILKTLSDSAGNYPGLFVHHDVRIEGCRKIAKGEREWK